ncbi:MAG TPA: DUF664 domain-containing protein [Candidatus Eisenbacteria bacterium]|nr:DUF664 domain-containing protein [Candidatus Eisenbacteria bacterium]
MATMTHRTLPLPQGFRSSEAALFFASLEDQSRLLWSGLEGITPDELRWQANPGMNTIGMLLTHLAIVETWWTKLIVEKMEEATVQPVLGIGDDDDGMPIKPGERPIALLDGKDLAFFRDLNGKARAYVRSKMATMTDADLEAETPRTRPDGTSVAISGRWYLYHVLEHFSGHYGQILLLRHLYRDAKARG